MTSIARSRYENLQLHNVKTGVCINVAAQECSSRGEREWSARLGTDRAHAQSGSGVMNVEGIHVRNITGVGVGTYTAVARYIIQP